MLGEPSAASAPRDGNPQPVAFSLDPLRREGADALDTHGVPGLGPLTLREVGLTSDDAFHLREVIAADDLFLAAAATGHLQDLFPALGTITHAVCSYFAPGDPEPHTLELRPPHTLKLDHPADTPLILGWLLQSRFHLVQTTVALLLLLLTAGCIFPEDDGDTGDDEHEQVESQAEMLKT